ncbi:MAG: chromosome segregation protein SMC [Rhodocyclaceae bacterium]|nr:chromosome segregation protein SMC [Rhodocyclaceae bacterium]
MRLLKLKLSGFKSFVEPTTVLFPGARVGVVGPNGCGKSNIIDAVRWVLGESKASELRGESIQDVIFKGSGGRKEVSRASVELFFDNAQGRAAGQWSQYAEVTVKRVLDRAGNSNYYINNLHVRRRDVIDLFLGTGLGPRAYAIIGQGMISRIVEAKPEDLRFFLEEAAGVTKYKERRKETGYRLEGSRENLARVEDIRGELAGQIDRLTQQAEVAHQYRTLQDELFRRQNLLWLKKRNDAHAECARQARLVEEAINRVEAETASLRETEARVESARAVHFAASDSVHAAQSDMASAHAEVRRLESDIHHVRDSRARLETRLAQLEVETKHWSDEVVRVEQEEFRWQSLLTHSRDRAGQAVVRHAEAAAHLPEVDAAVQAAGVAVAEARTAQNEAQAHARLAEADRGHAIRALKNLEERHARLTQELSALVPVNPEQLAAVRAAESQAQTALQGQQENLGHLQKDLPDSEARLRAAREQLAHAHKGATEARARREALKQLQERVRPSGEIGQWLKARGLSDLNPLWQAIEVEPGWETAVEAVLRERLSALPVDEIKAREILQFPPPTTFAFALPGAETLASIPNSLRAKVRCADLSWSAVLDDWLGEIETVDNLNPNLNLADKIGTGHFISRQGHRLTPCGLNLHVPDIRTHGIIERQREIEELDTAIDARTQEETKAREAQQGAERVLADVQSRLTDARRALEIGQQRAHATHIEAIKLGDAQTRYEERAGRLTQEMEGMVQAEQSERDEMTRAETELVRCRTALEAASAGLVGALDVQRRTDVTLREARALEHHLSREVQEAGFSERECVGRLAENARVGETANGQLTRLAGESEVTRSELSGLSDAVLQEQLQSALTGKQEREQRLSTCRNALEAAAADLRLMDEQRLKLEQGLQPARDKITTLKLKAQESQLTEEQFQARLTESAADEDSLTPELVPSLKESHLVGDIARLTAESEALGHVNLAALEELTTATERKGFLDAQSADLNTAIHTLEEAIRRIDRETRSQLQETYDAVNGHFGTLFPQLFGGGDAKLLLTGEEILDAGIQIMAQPPGKKNSTIHLLSGGEKALTAIALVFALFQLNPAPFCLLDEVDAPLDDSNTERFCELVKRMSQETQFIFITHNKIAMEMAQQLIGVTMREQGVSRVVEVDMEEALRMATKEVT